jgi:hypothetical protein
MSGRDNEGTAEKGGRGRRRPPTIEATAERVTDEAATSEAAAPESASPESATPESAGPQTPAPDVSEAIAAESIAPAAAPDPETLQGVDAEPAPPRPEPRPERRSLAVPIGLAAVIGALVGGAVAYGGARFLQPQADGAQAVAPLAARLDALERRLAGLDPALKALDERVAAAEAAAKQAAGAPATAAPDLGPLQQRLDALESAVKQLPAPAEGSGSAAEMTALADAQRQQAGELAAMREKLVAVTAAEAHAETQAAAPATLAVAEALGRALAAGRPYQSELAALGRLGQPADALAPLQAFAKDGAPTSATLANEFSRLADGFAAPTEPAAGQSLTERLLASAAHLVRIRPVGAPAGDDVAAVSARIEAALRRGDFAAIPADAAKLPADAARQAAPVLDKARARHEANLALTRIEQGIFAAIAGGN